MGNECCAGRENKKRTPLPLHARLNDEEEIKKITLYIKQAFEAADKNHNGKLEFTELYDITALSHEFSGLPKPDVADVRRVLEQGDTNHDHVLSLEEYTQMVLKHLRETAEIEKKKAEEAERLAKEQADKEKAEKEAKEKAEKEAKEAKEKKQTPATGHHDHPHDHHHDHPHDHHHDHPHDHHDHHHDQHDHPHHDQNDHHDDDKHEHEHPHHDKPLEGKIEMA